jgi:16S rRNA (uracil1498-N3)-methyltransferase
MRANYRMQRLYITADLAAGRRTDVAAEAVNYLANVLRMKDGDEILVFNGRDGEWRAALRFESKKKLALEPLELTREQPETPDLIYCFAPLKQGRLDYLVQKAVEMGAGILQPVITQHTQVSRIGIDRIEANAVEAAEQCGVLAIPETREPINDKMAHRHRAREIPVLCRRQRAGALWRRARHPRHPRRHAVKARLGSDHR